MTKVKCNFCGQVHTEKEWLEQTKDYIKETRRKTIEVDEMKKVTEIVSLERWKRVAYIYNCPECKAKNNGDQMTIVE